MNYRRIAISTIAVAALGLAACTSPETQQPGDAVTVAPTAGDTQPAQPTETTEQAPPAETTPAEQPADVPAGAEEQLASALAAIDFAEAELGGIAHKIDDEDNNRSWEIKLLLPDGSHVEAEVDRDATQVLRTENEDSDITQAPPTTIQEAINAAFAHLPGVLDDAELDREDGRLVWEVEFDQTARGDDVDVYLDATTLEVIKVD